MRAYSGKKSGAKLPRAAFGAGAQSQKTNSGFYQTGIVYPKIGRPTP